MLLDARFDVGLSSGAAMPCPPLLTMVGPGSRIAAYRGFRDGWGFYSNVIPGEYATGMTGLELLRARGPPADPILERAITL